MQYLTFVCTIKYHKIDKITKREKSVRIQRNSCYTEIRNIFNIKIVQKYGITKNTESHQRRFFTASLVQF